MMDGRMIQGIRMKAGLTQLEFARELGIQSVASWETGRHLPSIESMKKLKQFCQDHEIDSSELETEYRNRLTRDSDNLFIQLRKATGLSQFDFAKSLGVRSVSNWETGRCFPNYKSMQKIAAFCEVTGLDYSRLQEVWTERNLASSVTRSVAQLKRRAEERRSMVFTMDCEIKRIRKRRKYARVLRRAGIETRRRQRSEANKHDAG